MGASLNEQRRVSEDGLRIVKLCDPGRAAGRGNASCETVPGEQAPANYVPAAAVIRRGQALSGMTGRKARAGGSPRLWVKDRGSTPGVPEIRADLRVGEVRGIPRVAVKCVEMWRNTSGEGA
jgi:hypothetical protein